MPRTRTNDPLGVSDNPPNIVTDPARVEAALAEFRQRATFIEGTYRSTLAAIGSDIDFNRSLMKLKRSLARIRPAKTRGERAHPEVEMVILKHSMDHASIRTGERGTELTQVDVQAGARKAAGLLEPRRGRSRNSLLRYYVEALMALIQDYTGRPVLLTLSKDNLYDPQAVNTGGRILLILAERMEPTATASTIASIVKQARRKYAGKPMHFAEFFPTYGLGPDWVRNADEANRSVHTLVVLPFCPIYFP